MSSALFAAAVVRRGIRPAAVACAAYLLTFLAASNAWASYAGTLDPSFGTAGTVSTQIIPGTPNIADSLALQPDGKIVVGGYARAAPENGGVPSTAFVARLLSDGQLDRTFGDGGRVVLSGVGGFAPSTVPFDEQPSPPVRLKVLLTSDGHILVLGSSLIQLNSNGSLDTSFGSAGTATLPAGFSPAGIAPALNGEIVIVGNNTLSSRAGGAVVRLTGEGQPDRTFGSSGDGVVVLPLVDDPSGRTLATIDYRGVAVSGNGTITVAGVGRPPEGNRGHEILPREGLLARLTAAGSLDSAFGSGGQTVVERYGGVESFDSFDPNALLLTGDERVLVGAATCAGYGRCFPTFIVFPADGSGEGRSGLGASGLSGCTPGYCSQSLSLTPLPGGGVLGGAWEGDLLLERFNSGLEPVNGFGGSEEGEDVSYRSATALAQLPAGSQAIGNVLVLPNGKVVVGGTASAYSGGAVLVARLFGLSPVPGARISLTRQRAQSSAGLVSVLVTCGPYVACRGQGTLQARSTGSRGRPPRWVLAAGGPFDLAAGGAGSVVMPLTPAGVVIMRRKRSTQARLTLSPRGAGALRARVPVPRPTPPPPARGGTPGALTPVAGDVTAFIADGHRYVAFEQGTVIYVLDTRTERRYAARLPVACVKAGEALQGVSFPMVLLSCESGSFLLDAATGHARRLVPAIAEEQGRIGRFWVGPASAPDCANRYVCEEYLNWHTGAIRRIDSPPTPPTSAGAVNEVQALNLDSAELSPVAACPPFAPSNLDNSLVAYPMLNEQPYLIYGQAVDPVNGNPMNSAPQAPPGLLLGRCGTATPLVLDATAGAVNPRFSRPGDQIGAGIVSWYSPPSTTVSLYEIAQARRIDWDVPTARPAFSMPAAVAHTAYAAIVATASDQFCDEECTTDSWTLYQARLR